ncbi:MAG: nucleotidyltransferase family protein [Gemmatimonadota bacterium]|nr:MAG: nucleotidyltransferase family protein [Gemmatimonadota bacterium]
MGRAKALLEGVGQTFLERAVGTLRAGGCEDVVVVFNDEEDELLAPAAQAGGRLARGAGVVSQQIDSLRSGVRALPPGAEAAVILPVDHPLVQPSTVALLVGAFRSSGAPIVRVVHSGRHGHPVLLSAALFDELLSSPLEEGARSLIRAHIGEVAEVEVDDPGVLIDVDTPEEYERYKGVLE